jgi:hypothetical protein
MNELEVPTPSGIPCSGKGLLAMAQEDHLVQLDGPSRLSLVDALIPRHNRRRKCHLPDISTSIKRGREKSAPVCYLLHQRP